MTGSEWYKEMAVYQIWLRSFCDGNGDGIGDLWGVLSKLDYIKSLNVDAIWFSPIYPSPNADYGYDVSDYMDIHPDFGSLEVFKRVLNAAHDRGLRVFMDLVLNHTSDEHRWFAESRRSRDNPYRDYYYWRPGRMKGGKRLPPNNWTGYFGGDAWEYDSETDEYYLHLFSKRQPDLNLSNPKVRAEIKNIMRFWLDMGVDGFREDAVNSIAKAPGLPSSYPKLPRANGRRYFSNLPRIYDYLWEFKRDVLNYYDCFTVAEMSGAGTKDALRYAGEGPGKVLDELISTDHMKADCRESEFSLRPFDLRKMKKAFSTWQTELEGQAWNALYIENHDHARIISRYGDESYRNESGKMLAAMYILQRGTPFIYQGQEIGMTNFPLPRIEMYRDVMTRGAYGIALGRMGKKAALNLVQRTSRENSRTPVQWSSGRNAGFSDERPWFPVNSNYLTVNVEAEERDPESILNFYRRLLRFRRDNPIVIYGSYTELMPDSRELYVYERRYQGKKLLVICSFTRELVRFELPEDCRLSRGRLVLANYEQNFVIANGFTSRPYELRVYLFDRE
jgi:glycosidase